MSLSADGLTETSGDAMRAAFKRALVYLKCYRDNLGSYNVHAFTHTYTNKLHCTLVNTDTFMVPERSIILWKLHTIYRGNQAIAANKTAVAFCDYGWQEIKRRQRGNDMHII